MFCLALNILLQFIVVNKPADAVQVLLDLVYDFREMRTH